MATTAKYIYGILNSNDEKIFDCSEDMIRKRIYTIAYRDISAVVSDSDETDITYLPKDILAMQLVEHQRVIERVMTEHTVIPMRLGTIAADEKEVETILANGYRTIKDVLAKINNRVEVDVAATWNDFGLLLKEIGEEKEIKDQKERLLANPSKVSIEDQMKIGFMVKKALDKKREQFAAQILSVLSTVSRACKEHDLMDDKMASNLAFLIDKSEHEDFERKLEELNTMFSEKLNFRCIDPLPPYSFYTIEVKNVEFEELDQARKKLGLQHIFNKEEIKKAYQRSAALVHPDKNPDALGMEKEFNEVNKAYKMLMEYCLSCEHDEQNDRFYINEQQTEDKAILVRVRQ